MQTRLDISSIAGIKENIHELFALIQENLDAYSSNPGDTQLIETCRTYIHQLDGLFQVLELKSITVITEKIEQLTTDLIAPRSDATQAAIDVIKRAINAILEYLDRLIDGAKENPARLFPAYQGLMHRLGYQQVSELDLFFPALTEDPPLKPVINESNPRQLKLLAKRACAEYRTGLVQLLKNISVNENLKKMHHALTEVEQLPGSTEQRIFWWIAAGFLENLASRESDVELSDRKLCGKIEQILRHSAENSSQNTAQLRRELLYRLTKCQHSPASEQIEAIRKAYSLPSPTDTGAAESDRLTSPQDNLHDIREIIKQANENWQAFCSGKHNDLTAFLNDMAHMRELSSRLQCMPAQQLIDAIDQAARLLHVQQSFSTAVNEQATMEIATALLHLESIVENYNVLPSDLSAQTESISTRLKSMATIGEADAALNAGPSLSEIKNPARKKQLQAQTVQEVLANLQQTEKILEQFFQAPDERESLSSVIALFNQTAGVLDIMELKRAHYLLSLCLNQVKKFSEPDYVLTHNDQNLLVDGLSSLSFFLEAYKNNPNANQSVIEAAIAVFENSVNQKTAESSTADALAAESDNEETDIMGSEIIPDVYPGFDKKIDSGVDPELLNIFLEEADEILAEITECIQNCQSDKSDMKSLTAIRRNFHTLKGSGRMVKLEFFSDAAWTMEKTLNHWLNEKKQITDGLLSLMQAAHSAFTSWCSSLKTTGEAEIQLDQLHALINQLDAGEEKMRGSRPGLKSAKISLESGSMHQDTISIGGIAIPVDLFEIFTIESKQHLATLEMELKTLLDTHPAKINQPFTLAAHTLASTSRAIKLDFIADLCSKLEEWLTRLREADAPLGESDAHLIQNCIQQISELLHKVLQQQLPDDTDLQLAHFLTLEIAKQQTRSKESTILKHSERSEPINLNEYRLKKTPPAIQDETSRDNDAPQEIAEDTLDAVSIELLQTFLEEAKDTIPQISTKLRAWRILPQDEDIRISLLRLLHTLKGSAHMIGAQQLGELIHATEEEVERAYNSPVVSIRAIETVEYQFDQICETIERLQSKGTADQTQDTTDAAIPDSSAALTNKSELQSPASSVTQDYITSPETKFEEAHQPINVLRIQTELIDRLVNDSGEASIIRSKIETQLNYFKQSLQDLTESIDRLHGQLREIEIQAETQMSAQAVQQHNNDESFDPLELDRFTRLQELTRLMAESIDDVMTVQKNLNMAHTAAVEATAQQAAINHQLQQELIRIRTVPFGSISERYYRVIRKAANDLGKKASLQIEGEATEIDRSVLEKMSASLEHILRNAVAHGIEKSDQRILSGKPEAGHIFMDLQQSNNEIVITIRDDGCGLDLDNIRKAAIKQGLINENEMLDDEQIAALIFAPGLTTQDHATDTAGRGIGMDIVQNDISGLGGQITVSSKKNRETVFHIRLPLMLAAIQTLVVSSGNQIYAIPATVVVQAQELNVEALQEAYRERRLRYDGSIYPFTYFPFYLGYLDKQFETKRHNHVLLLRSGGLRLAIHIDEFIGKREVIVKKIGSQIMHAPGVEGATVTGEGKPALIFNPLKLLCRQDVQQILQTPVSDIISRSTEREKPAATVLVVDDSLTVRKVTSRLLEHEGYNVLTAKQGLEAIETISDIKPDIIFADLEMPKMNGFEFIQRVRSNPDTAQIPIIVITSRTAEKHRKMALELGANEFMGKPYKEDDLLNHISHYIPKNS
ncbi:chemosensory pili system protein ChpA (sensor histidine kinase/response regulator) [Nitrosomonas sp. Nm51]|uniref:hybrid sensor histidine kinase/response regulator n=1 Tax=Nitrosomonas sp. Nm51 TaxID=133720 RepID=UPI0008B1D2EE|nr:Hpt domain-containing protein [Nitrosomonas sp. Nm51]SER18671.1 chemosensory pili system protein ChpA (sensor histidine kinase/response regulator) [Nitrosomonas sp. Nm51]